MAQIIAVYRGSLGTTIGLREERLEAATVSEVLCHIRSSHGKAAHRAARAMLIVVDGVSILHKKVFATQLDNGSVVSFLPIAAGG